MTTAGVASLLPLPVVIPIGGAVAAPLLARIHRRLPLIVSTIALLGATAVLAVIASRVYQGDGFVVSHFFGHWGPVNGRALGIAFAVDPFGLSFALLSAALGTLLVASALSELGRLGPRELGGFACLFQLLIAALIGCALTADMINLFVWFEVAALSSYGLAGFFLERPIALEATFKMLVLTTIAGFAIFIGAAVLYANHGALNFGQLHNSLNAHIGTPDLLALALLITGFGTKAGIAPFHAWLPDAHSAAPGAVSALFSALMVDLGVIAIARIVFQIFGSGTGRPLLGLLTGLGLSSALLGAALALAQDDLKRLLAWDTVSQMGILIVGFATATAAGIAGATYHLINHALFKALLFLCAGAVVHATGETSLSRMGGLARRRPLLTAAFTVGALAIAGIPPLNGYASLGLLHVGVRESGGVGLEVATVLAQVITVAALGRAAYLGFYRRRKAEYEHLEPLRWGMRTVLIVLGASCVAFGALPGVVIDHVAIPAASALLHPAEYTAGVLKGHIALLHASVRFSYVEPSHIVVTSVTVVLGIALAVRYVCRGEPAVVRLLRAAHNGSVNDYVAFLAAGFLTAVVVLWV
jgi:multicomponent Na+:H+ antiporter subunit D